MKVLGLWLSHFGRCYDFGQGDGKSECPFSLFEEGRIVADNLSHTLCLAVSQ